jgi:hypothetical protein
MSKIHDAGAEILPGIVLVEELGEPVWHATDAGAISSCDVCFEVRLAFEADKLACKGSPRFLCSGDTFSLCKIHCPRARSILRT